jgi:transposase
MANATGRPIAPLILSSDEQAYLERQVRRHRVARSLSERCRIILRCADGVPSKSVASELGVHEHTVGKWRRRFLTDRIDGLLDEARLRAGSYEAMLNWVAPDQQTWLQSHD